ncbi:MAG: hypothetical protein ACOX7F_05060 [Eubacteriales bacterium]|jgi:hypothetical protein
MKRYLAVLTALALLLAALSACGDKKEEEDPIETTTEVSTLQTPDPTEPSVTPSQEETEPTEESTSPSVPELTPEPTQSKPDSPEARQVAKDYVELLAAFWLEPFSSTSQINQNVLVMYSAVKGAGSGQMNNETGCVEFSASQMSALVKQYFGIENFNGQDTDFYDASRDVYAVDPNSVGGEIQVTYEEGKKTENGVEVTVKANVAETGRERVDTYTLNQRSDGSYYFVGMD